MIRTIFAWLAASIVGYILFAITSQTVVLNGLVHIGAPMPFSARLQSTFHAVLNMPALGLVLAAAFAIAFAVARGLKSIVKPFASVAYPLAGGAAVSAALELMWLQYEIYPVLGAQKPMGYGLAVLSGVAAGVVFAALLPKKTL
ncbi:MAG: hypothetical protein AAF221_10325 [Pseudomonadota bacterium]